MAPWIYLCMNCILGACMNERNELLIGEPTDVEVKPDIAFTPDLTIKSPESCEC